MTLEVNEVNGTIDVLKHQRNAALDDSAAMAGKLRQATATVQTLQQAVVERDATIAERDAAISKLEAKIKSQKDEGKK